MDFWTVAFAFLILGIAICTIPPITEIAASPLGQSALLGVVLLVLVKLFSSMGA